MAVRLLVEVHPAGTVVKTSFSEVFFLNPFPSDKSWQIWLRVLLTLSVCTNIAFELSSMIHLRGYYARRNSAVRSTVTWNC